MADELPRLLAPVLPFTADEVWELLPARREESVHLALFPERRGWDAALVAEWQTSLLAARAAALKRLEEARAARLIGSGLEASLSLTAPPELYGRLEAYERGGPVFPSNLASLFIVSKVDLKQGPELSVEVARAEGGKCERCWMYSPSVGRAAGHADVCERCAAVLEAL
jgi:isoleucyl-tRNA synthetase